MTAIQVHSFVIFTVFSLSSMGNEIDCRRFNPGPAGAPSYRTQPHLRRYSEASPPRSTLKLLWILRTPPHAPNLPHGSRADRCFCGDARRSNGIACSGRQDRSGQYSHEPAARHARASEVSPSHQSPCCQAQDCPRNRPPVCPHGWACEKASNCTPTSVNRQVLSPTDRTASPPSIRRSPQQSRNPPA
jgi:hypothetical protein